MEVILDTNFIVSCVKRKIDFLDVLAGMGFRVVLPREVMQELKDLKMKTSHADRMAIELAFDIIGSSKIKKIRLGDMEVDKGLIEKGRTGIYIATLDAVIKREVPNRVVISNAKNSLEVERS